MNELKVKNIKGLNFESDDVKIKGVFGSPHPWIERGLPALYLVLSVNGETQVWNFNYHMFDSEVGVPWSMDTMSTSRHFLYMNGLIDINLYDRLNLLAEKREAAQAKAKSKIEQRKGYLQGMEQALDMARQKLESGRLEDLDGFVDFLNGMED